MRSAGFTCSHAVSRAIGKSCLIYLELGVVCNHKYTCMHMKGRPRVSSFFVVMLIYTMSTYETLLVGETQIVALLQSNKQQLILHENPSRQVRETRQKGWSLFILHAASQTNRQTEPHERFLLNKAEFIRTRICIGRRRTGLAKACDRASKLQLTTRKEKSFESE